VTPDEPATGASETQTPQSTPPIAEPTPPAPASSIPSNVSVGDQITFGSFEGTPIEWRVLDVSFGRALVIAEEVLTRRMYHGDFADTNGNGGVYGDAKEWDLNGNGEWDQEERERFACTWETSDIREWLNNSFYSNSFSSDEASRIAQTTISNPDNAAWGTPGGNSTGDKVFLLNIDEVNRYFSHDGVRVANYGKNGACWWWLRSPGVDGSYAARVDYGGRVLVGGSDVNLDAGVRPAMYLDLNG
jgi:hypothetical protein